MCKAKIYLTSFGQCQAYPPAWPEALGFITVALQPIDLYGWKVSVLALRGTWHRIGWLVDVRGLGLSSLGWATVGVSSSNSAGILLWGLWVSGASITVQCLFQVARDLLLSQSQHWGVVLLAPAACLLISLGRVCLASLAFGMGWFLPVMMHWSECKFWCQLMYLKLVCVFSSV